MPDKMPSTPKWTYSALVIAPCDHKSEQRVLADCLLDVYFEVRRTFQEMYLFFFLAVALGKVS